MFVSFSIAVQLDKLIVIEVIKVNARSALGSTNSVEFEVEAFPFSANHSLTKTKSPTKHLAFLKYVRIKTGFTEIATVLTYFTQYTWHHRSREQWSLPVARLCRVCRSASALQ